MKKYQLKRRVFLKGSGSVLVGLPLIEECFNHKAFAMDAAIPKRCLTMSFGLGIEKALQDERWDGPLEPLRSIAPKTTFFSNLKNSHLKGQNTPHFGVGATQFTGVEQDGNVKAGGPSLEQIMRRHFHPGGVPTLTGLTSKSAGIWSRTGAITQYIRHWNSDGSPGEKPERRPSRVFDALFGRVNSNPNDGNNTNGSEHERESRIRRSILDTTLEQYNSLVGTNSYLGQASKERINNHLETIRSIEQELINADLAASEIEAGENTLQNLPNSNDFNDPDGISFYDAPSGPLTGPKVDWRKAQQAFRLNGKLMAIGLNTDALRFGSMLFVGAGEHIRFTGTYNAANIGESLDFSRTFDSRSPHDGIFHNFVRNSVRVYQHYVISQLAYVLNEMDNITEPNGKTVLDNTLVVLSTEYGKNHEGDKNIFQAIVGANQLFKPGHYTSNWGYNDVYKTVLDAYNVNHSIAGNRINEILN